MTTYTNEPKAWIGCLHCYNDGRLIGGWYDSTELIMEEMTLEDVHERGGYPVTEGCEELWVMDHENFPVRGEMDPMTAMRYAEMYDELDSDDEWPAYMAYLENWGSDGSVSDFRDRYKGTWDDMEDFIYNLEEDLGTFNDLPDVVKRHFDWTSYSEEMGQDFHEADAPDGQVYIFFAH